MLQGEKLVREREREREREKSRGQVRRKKLYIYSGHSLERTIFVVIRQFFLLYFWHCIFLACVTKFEYYRTSLGPRYLLLERSTVFFEGWHSGLLRRRECGREREEKIMIRIDGGNEDLE